MCECWDGPRLRHPGALHTEVAAVISADNYTRSVTQPQWLSAVHPRPLTQLWASPGSPVPPSSTESLEMCADRVVWWEINLRINRWRLLKNQGSHLEGTILF